MENLLKGSLAQSQLQHWWPSYLRTGPFPRWLKRPPRGGTCLPLSSIVKMRSTSLWLWIFCMERHKVCLVYKIQRSGYLLAISNKGIFTCVIYIFCLHNEIKFKNEFVELMYIGSPPYGLCRISSMIWDMRVEGLKIVSYSLHISSLKMVFNCVKKKSISFR